MPSPMVPSLPAPARPAQSEPPTRTEATWTGFETSSTPRLLSELSADNTSEAWRIQVGLAWSFNWYGIPVLYSGVEMGFNGLCFTSPEDRRQMEAALEKQGVSAVEAASVLRACDYTVFGGSVDAGFWRQDFFSGRPLHLGSAAASIQAQRSIGRSLMTASGPHWCEDPLVDRSNDPYQLTRALIRIRRSSTASQTVLQEPAHKIACGSEEVAYWKYADDASANGNRIAMLLVLEIKRAPDTTASEYALPAGLDYDEGQAFVDLLHPSRMATVVQKAVSKTLLLPADLEEAYAAIFAPKGEEVADKPGFWLVCAHGAPSLPLLRSEAAVCLPRYRRLGLTTGAFTLTLLVILVVLLFNLRSNIYLSVVKGATIPSGPPARSGQKAEPEHVLATAIEHTIPTRGVRVSAGGLGKVLDQTLREHPKGTLSLMHSMFGDVKYWEMEKYRELQVVVDGKLQSVTVYKISSKLDGLQRNWYLLHHELVVERSKKSPCHIRAR